MKKTLIRSKTFDSDLTKLDKRISRQSTLASFGHSTEFDYKRETKTLAKILQKCAAAHTLDFDCMVHFFSAFTCEQRMIIVRDLEYEYNYKLLDLVLQRPASAMRSCTLALLVEPIELYVRDFHDLLAEQRNALDNVKLSRQCLEILISLNNVEIHKFQELNQQIFKNRIDHEIQDVYGDESILGKLFIEILKGQRDEDAEYSVPVAKVIAKKLYEAGEGTPGIDYETFIKIFTCDAFAHLSAIFDIYEDKYDRPIQEAIEREFQGLNGSQCFQDIVDYTRSPNIYYSKILRQALDEKPIDYRTIIRILIGHQEKDLSEIQLEFHKAFDQSLDQFVLQRTEPFEMKRLFILLLNKQGDTLIDEDTLVRFDHANNSSHSNSTGNNNSPTQGMRRNRSQEAFDKFVNVFKTMRPH